MPAPGAFAPVMRAGQSALSTIWAALRSLNLAVRANSRLLQDHPDSAPTYDLISPVGAAGPDYRRRSAAAASISRWTARIAHTMALPVFREPTRRGSIHQGDVTG